MTDDFGAWSDSMGIPPPYDHDLNHEEVISELKKVFDKVGADVSPDVLEDLSQNPDKIDRLALLFFELRDGLRQPGP
jgi:hypothetical protein